MPLTDGEIYWKTPTIALTGSGLGMAISATSLDWLGGVIFAGALAYYALMTGIQQASSGLMLTPYCPGRKPSNRIYFVYVTSTFFLGGVFFVLFAVLLGFAGMNS